jgi:hypothetical protein
MIKVSVLYPSPERTTKFDIAYYLVHEFGTSRSDR